jgi:anaerobic selenocysteine-containing dehydrogenase
MVQHRVDPLTGAAREDVLISAEDAARLRIADGDRVRLTSAAGRFEGRARIDAIKPGNVEVHWPEGNGLLSREEIDAASKEPDYNAVADLERLGP